MMKSMVRGSRSIRVLVARAGVLLSLGLGLWVAPVAAAENPLVRFDNGEIIAKSDLDAYLGRRVDLRPVARNYWGADAVLREMALTRTLVLEGERLKEPRPETGDLDRFDDIYGLAVFKKLTPACERPDDAAMAKTFFEQNPDAFRIPSSVHVKRIMLPAETRMDELSTMEWLMLRAEAIAKGTESFDSVAERAAAVYKLETQGDVGWVLLSGEASILGAFASAEKGDLVGPLREGEFGYLFQILDKREGRALTWKEAEPSAMTRAVSYCREQAHKRLRDKLFQQYGVVFDANAIRSVFRISREAPASAPASKGD